MSSADHWKSQARAALETFGHRNWIVVADSAYPEHSDPGIETLATHEHLTGVLRWLIDELSAADHIRPIVHLDSELSHMTDADSPGVEKLRNEIESIVQDQPVVSHPHDEIIHSLDEAAKLFRVLLLKTSERIPYTSVFLELQCGYWSSEQEHTLRARIREATK